MADDTQRDSDSDWDSTLDFTSPRQVGIGQLRPEVGTEIEEESALSEESDIDADHSVQNDKQVIRNVLKPQDERPRAPSPNQKENNIVLAQRQHNVQQRREQAANQQAQQRRTEPDPPPYNFRDALPADRGTPEPAGRGPPGKDRKGTTYDPSPRQGGRPMPQGSIRSVGSWDDSDQDERTLREIRNNYQQEKSKEEQKQKEEQSMTEEPNTARSESNKKGWKFGKKNKQAKSNGRGTPQATPRGQHQGQGQAVPLSARSQGTSEVFRTQAQTAQTQGPRVQAQAGSMAQPAAVGQTQAYPRQTTPVTATRNVPASVEVVSPAMVEVYDQIYSTPEPRSGRYHMAPPTPRPTTFHTAPGPEAGLYSTAHMGSYPGPQGLGTPIGRTEEEMIEEPEKMIDKDEDGTRQVYFFGHGNLRYLEVNEDEQEATLPKIADKVDRIVQRLWQEVFAVFRIIFSIIIWFIVELFKFLAKHVFQPLIIGVVMTFGDHVMKPLLSVLFNGFVQPVSIFFWNFFTGAKHMFNPIGDVLRRVLEQVAMLCRSIRLCDVTWVARGDSAKVETV